MHGRTLACGLRKSVLVVLVAAALVCGAVVSAEPTHASALMPQSAGQAGPTPDLVGGGGGGCSYYVRHDSSYAEPSNGPFWHADICATGPYYDYYGRRYYSWTGSCWVSSAAQLQTYYAFTYKLGCVVTDYGAGWISAAQYAGPTSYPASYPAGNTPPIVFTLTFGSYSSYSLPTDLYVDFIGDDGYGLGNSSGIWQIDCSCVNPTEVSKPNLSTDYAHLYLP